MIGAGAGYTVRRIIIKKGRKLPDTKVCEAIPRSLHLIVFQLALFISLGENSSESKEFNKNMLIWNVRHECSKLIQAVQKKHTGKHCV
jgi:hypothetical protein